MLQKKFKLFQYKLSTHKQYIFHKKFSLTRKKRGKNHEHCIITATVHYMFYKMWPDFIGNQSHVVKLCNKRPVSALSDNKTSVSPYK